MLSYNEAKLKAEEVWKIVENSVNYGFNWLSPLML